MNTHGHAPDERLDRLSSTERDLLRLLGEGHTAKSIAALTGLSPAAVNERFRAARRKTGLGSSREIARLILAQENRDDFIGLVPALDPRPASPRADAPRRRVRIDRWRYPMIIAALGAVAVLAEQSVRTEAPPPSPLARVVLADETRAPNIAELHGQVSSEPADPDWAPGAEAALRAAYLSLPDFDRIFAQTTVRCGASLCAILAATPNDADVDGFTAIIQTLQQTRPPEGLAFVTSRFGTSAGGTTPLTYAAYFRRED